MASYFDEHDCEPLGQGQQPNHLLHLARLLLDTGLGTEWQMEFDSIFQGAKPAPPASKKIVDDLPHITITSEHTAQDMKCPVCLGEYEEGKRSIKMPCGHNFHPDCLLPWLNKTNTCPLCRHELPTDDPDYEEYKRQKERAKERQYQLEALHDSMFG